MTTLGQIGEGMVEEEYRKQGYRLLARNYKLTAVKQVGEIDLIFQKNKEIIFVEVKSRSSTKFGSAFEAVDIFKQRKLIRTAKLYMQRNSKFSDYNYRIDVAAVDIDPIRSQTSNGVDNSKKVVIILKNAIEDLH